MPPRVSVLLAVHNGAAFVELALASILRQTFGDFELIIVDDASTDDTPAILERQRDARVRVIRNASNLDLAAGRAVATALRGAVHSRVGHVQNVRDPRRARRL